MAGTSFSPLFLQGFFIWFRWFFLKIVNKRGYKLNWYDVASLLWLYKDIVQTIFVQVFQRSIYKKSATMSYPYHFLKWMIFLKNKQYMMSTLQKTKSRDETKDVQFKNDDWGWLWSTKVPKVVPNYTFNMTLPSLNLQINQIPKI